MEEKPKTRRRWFRFSLRTMLVLMTVVCIVAGVGGILWNRSVEFSRRAAYHRKPARLTDIALVELFHPNWQPYFEHLRLYHQELAAKYERAAKYPWLPVEPDLPKPKRPATQD